MAKNGKISMDEGWDLEQKLRNYADLYAEDQRKVEGEYFELNIEEQLRLKDYAPLHLKGATVVAAIEEWGEQGQKLYDIAHTIIPELAMQSENGILLMELLTIRDTKPSTEGNPKLYKKLLQAMSANS